MGLHRAVINSYIGLHCYLNVRQGNQHSYNLQSTFRWENPMAYLVIKLLLQGNIQQRLKILVIVPHGNLKGIVHGTASCIG